MDISASRSLVDGSMLVVEAAARAGVDTFVGYPITPANLLYLHSSKRFPLVLPATDEITTLQWMAGLSATGHIPMTATSYPGLALMIESIGMAFMMELPMLIVLSQRLGPATGTATCGAQGDILLVRGINSGGYPIPTFCISGMDDCWTLTAKAVETAIRLRTPVILLTSKEMSMTLRDADLDALPQFIPYKINTFSGPGEYVPYGAAKATDAGSTASAAQTDTPPVGVPTFLPVGVPTFLPVGNPDHRVRLTASTHDENGDLQHTSPGALANTARLYDKIVRNLPAFTEFEYDKGSAGRLIIAFDITAEAARDALDALRANGIDASLLIPKTLFPVPEIYMDIARSYDRVVIAEENHDGQYRHILFGEAGRAGVSGVNAVGRMIAPDEIVAEAAR